MTAALSLLSKKKKTTKIKTTLFLTVSSHTIFGIVFHCCLGESRSQRHQTAVNILLSPRPPYQENAYQQSHNKNDLSRSTVNTSFRLLARKWPFTIMKCHRKWALPFCACLLSSTSNHQISLDCECYVSLLLILAVHAADKYLSPFWRTWVWKLQGKHLVPFVGISTASGCSKLLLIAGWWSGSKQLSATAAAPNNPPLSLKHSAYV